MNGCAYIRNYDIPVCSACGGSVEVRDSRKRTVRDSDGIQHTFKLRRLKCLVCGKLHLELPDFMKPNKHYSKNVIDSVLSGECDYCAADNSTIYRWQHEK